MDIFMDSEEITGRAKGGVATAKSLTKAELKMRAEKAAAARWSGEIKEATHGSPDHPLKIGNIEIPCYVLEGDIRVLSQRGLQTGIGMSTSGGSGGAHRLAQFIETLAEKGVDCKDLAVRIRNPIQFRPKGIGRTAYGYEATILADICDVILAARQAKGVLQPNQAHIADQCELLVRGFARVGIIALIDEATGFQKDRKKDALAEILEAFIDKELQPWLPTFDSDFYEGIFRLRGLNYEKDTVKRPSYFGHITNDIVYKRLAPGVLEELKKVTPKDSAGRNKHQLFRRLTANKGYPSLKQLLGSLVTMMKLSANWQDFMEKLNKIHPRFGETLPLPFENDTGKGL
jgi:hypothetical protein